MKYIDKNNIQDIISEQNIQVTHSNTLNFDTTDNFLFYNYDTNFDWSASNEGYYISAIDEEKNLSYGICNEGCKRCFGNTITQCYECNSGFVLIGKECVPVSVVYARTPNGFTLRNDLTSLPLNLLTEYTISFWMKYLGVISTSNSVYPILFQLNSNTHIDFDTKNQNLVLTIETSILRFYF